MTKLSTNSSLTTNQMTKLLQLGSYLMHVDEYTVVLTNKIEKLGLYIQKSKLFIKVKL